jgi:hypothetical protein
VQSYSEGVHQVITRAALYFCESPAMYKRALVASDTQPRYIVDVDTVHRERLQLNVVRTNDSLFHDVQLSSIKVVGEYIVLTGAEGFIGIGCVAKSTAEITNSNSVRQKVLYVVPCKSKSKSSFKKSFKSLLDIEKELEADQMRQMDSMISCVATPSREGENFFITADGSRSLSLWTLVAALNDTNDASGASSPVEKPTRRSSLSALFTSPKKKTGFYYSVKPVLNSSFKLEDIDPAGVLSDEKIVGLQFLYPKHSSYLLVSTTKRLLLLTISHEVQDTPSGSPEKSKLYIITGYTELDRVQNTEEKGIFSLTAFAINLPSPLIAIDQITNDPVLHERRFCYWKAINSGADGDKSWLATKGEVSEEKILEAIAHMKAIEEY